MPYAGPLGPAPAGLFQGAGNLEGDPGKLTSPDSTQSE